MANLSFPGVRLRWPICLALIVVIIGCSQQSATPDQADDYRQNLLSYQPLADKLQEIFTAAYDPGPVTATDYERLVGELAQAAEQRKPFESDSSPGARELEELVAPLLANHQATVNAAQNLAQESELIQKYRDGETLPENPELAEAVARAFPDGPPTPNEVGAFDKFNAANAMIDVKWEHVRKTRASSQAFLDAFQQLKKEALITDS